MFLEVMQLGTRHQRVISISSFHFIPEKTSLTWEVMREDLIEALGIQVDLLSEGAISPYLKDKIKDEAVVIYPEE